MKWRRRWDDDWFDWEEDGPKLIKRIVLGVISAALAVAGCFVFVSSNVGIYARDFTFERISGREAYRVTGLSTEGRNKADIVIPNAYNGLPVVELGAYAFRNCSRLTSVVIPDDVVIGENAFEGCVSLTFNEYENGQYLGNESNPYHALIKVKDNTSTAYTIHEDTKIIAGRAFYDCDSLTSVVIPDSVTMIGAYVFYNCDSLTSVVIGDSVTSIGSWAFYNCDALTSVVIGDSVTTIGAWAFEDCDGLTSVVIPDSVTTIGGSAFYDCDSLTSITVGENNTVYQSIDGNLYSKDGSVLIQYAIGKTATEFVVPEGVTSIGSLAFSSCDSLTSVIIPNSVTGIGNFAFLSCDSLTNVVIPDSVTSIGFGAFQNCSSLTSVEIPDSVTMIDYDAFSYCDSLTSVVIGDSVTKIGDRAFSSCDSLTSVVIPDSVTTIDNSAFYECYNLTSVVIPDSVTSIGYSAFSDCYSLTTVYYKGTASDWENIPLDGYNNDSLTDATRYYYSESEDVAMWWHYDAQGNVVHA